MRHHYQDIRLTDGDMAYLYPLGDVHLGDKNCDVKRLREYLAYIMKPDRYCFFVGDILNTATEGGASSIHDQVLTLSEQKDFAEELFSPLAEKGKIIAGINGNHEQRMEKSAGDDPMKDICKTLKVPYMGYSTSLHLTIGTKAAYRRACRKTPVPVYEIHVHHTVGGGDTPGGKANRVFKSAAIYPYADIYVGGHNHFEITFKTSVYAGKKNRVKATRKERLFVDAGAFLEYDGSYAEQKQLIPGTSGCPSIMLSGETKKGQCTTFLRWDE